MMPHRSKLFGNATLLIGVWWFLAAPFAAASLPAEYDFGTDLGKVTSASVDFLLSVDSGNRFEDVPDAIRLIATNRRFRSLAMVRPIEELGFQGQRDFQIETNITVSGFAGSNNRRFGVHLFDPGNRNEEGVFAGIIGNNEMNTRDLVVMRGLNNGVVARLAFASEGFELGERYTFLVFGRYLNANTLEITLTVTHGITSQTLVTTIDGRDINLGNGFGVSARLRRGWSLDVHDFSISSL